MNRSQILRSLEKAEAQVRIFLNKTRASRLKNRLRKFTHQPFKFLYLNALKSGLPLPKLVCTELFFGKRILLPLEDENAVVVYYTGTLDLPECALMRYLIANARPQEVFYDIGTHFGLYTLLMRVLLNGEGEVHSFEPNPHSAALLRRNGVPVNEVAVSYAEGTLDFFDTSGKKSATSSALIDAVSNSGIPYTIQQVRSITLDGYIENHTPPTLMKIDVEGWENMVLQGAGRVLSTSGPDIIMEIWDEPHVIERTMQAVTILKERGYIAYRILPDGSLNREDPIPGAIGEYENFCFKRK